jgi:5-methylthioadenosine/S-adenosylhomocysteine deaminase
MLRAGVNVALGTDSVASNNQYDLFAEMRMAAILQKGIKKDPSLMPVNEVLKMGTVNGARAMGFDDVGLLKPGMKADLIILDPDAENLSSAIDPLANIVYSAQGLNVRLTMVDGRVIYRDGAYMTIDAERALSRFREAQARVVG